LRRTIVDTGPLVALLNGRDAHHDWVREALMRIRPPLITCEAVLSEACFLVRKLRGGPDAVLAPVGRGIVDVPFRVDRELSAVRRLMSRYASVPMSLADACLVRMSELEDDPIVLTLDRDFRVYRRHTRQAIPLVAPDDD
jgi:predicted nucleic acid-binding protein